VCKRVIKRSVEVFVYLMFWIVWLEERWWISYKRRKIGYRSKEEAYYIAVPSSFGCWLGSGGAAAYFFLFSGK